MGLPFGMEPQKAEEQEGELKEKLTYERRKRTSTHKGRTVLPGHLPVEEIEIYPSEDITDMVCIGKEVTDELEYEPARYYIKRYVRYKYAPKSREGVIIGELPGRVIKKAFPGPGPWPPFWSISMRTTFRFTGNCNALKERISPLHPPPWKAGPGRALKYWIF